MQTLATGALPAVVTGPDEYVLDVAVGGSSVIREGPAGLFHRVVSFVGLLNVADKVMMLKGMVVHNTLQFEYRGHQVNVARNFRSKEALRKTINVMALCKVRSSICCTWP